MPKEFKGRTLHTGEGELAIFDIAKMVFAFFVVCIHTGIALPGIDLYFMQGLFRVAVPCFFFLAGYFLFGKIPAGKPLDESSSKTVRKYIIRIFVMYVIWSIFYLITVQVPGWLKNGFSLMDLVIYAEYATVRGDSYLHLWYLSSLYTGVALLYLFKKWFSTKVTLVISIALFVIGLFLQPYYFVVAPVVENIPVARMAFHDVFNRFIGSPRCGVFFGFMFVTLGAFFAEHKKVLNRWISLAGVIISLALSMAEITLIDRNWFWGEGTYGALQISHIPLIICLFCFLRSFDNIKVGHVKEIRSVSTLIYLLHPAVMLLVELIPNVGRWQNYPFTLGITVYILTIAVSVIWIKLEKNNNFRFLKKLR